MKPRNERRMNEGKDNGKIAIIPYPGYMVQFKYTYILAQFLQNRMKNIYYYTYNLFISIHI